MLSAPLFLQGGFSVPFVQYIGNPASHAALNSEETAPAERVARASTSGEPTSRTTGKNARSATANVAIDPRRLGRAATESEQGVIIDPARFASATAVGRDSASETLTVERLQQFAKQGISGGPDTGNSVAAPTVPAADMPHPTRRPAHEVATEASRENSGSLERLLESLPSERPGASQTDPVQVASIGPEPGTEAALAAASVPDGVLLPESAPVPAFRPERAVAPRPEKRTPAARAERQPAPSAPSRQRTRGGALAYAPPDGATDDSGGGLLGRIFGGGGTHSGLPGAGQRIAVYDISAATVYMPNGEKLEAHSGLAHMQDNPRYADEKNRGPTPPNVYNLQMRESLFHGVEAVRLLPADGRKKFNRDGLLAHTYMYRGGLSQSNGCVVFKNYSRFLTAFKRGKVTRMIVVPRLAELPTYMASL